MTATLFSSICESSGVFSYAPGLVCDTIFGMATGTGTLLELRLESEGLSGLIRCPAGMRPAPGQYLVAAGPDPTAPLPTILFPSGFGQLAASTATAELRVAPPLPSSWALGMSLALRGPLGHGFHMPHTARRVALACLDGAPNRLLPLVEQALHQQAAVTIYAGAVSQDLPEAVEILPLDMLPEALAWADFCAIDVDRSGLPGLRAGLGLAPYQQPACYIEVLVRTAMPCAGLAACGVCAVSTHHGYALSCTDGPVFAFDQLEGTNP